MKLYTYILILFFLTASGIHFLFILKYIPYEPHVAVVFFLFFALFIFLKFKIRYNYDKSVFDIRNATESVNCQMYVHFFSHPLGKLFLNDTELMYATNKNVEYSSIACVLKISSIQQLVISKNWKSYKIRFTANGKKYQFLIPLLFNKNANKFINELTRVNV